MINKPTVNNQALLEQYEKFKRLNVEEQDVIRELIERKIKDIHDLYEEKKDLERAEKMIDEWIEKLQNE